MSEKYKLFALLVDFVTVIVYTNLRKDTEKPRRENRGAIMDCKIRKG